MPPGSGMGRLSTRVTVYAVNTLERLGKRLEIAARYAPICRGAVVEIHSVAAIVAYKLVTHFNLHNRIDVDVLPHIALSHRASLP